MTLNSTINAPASGHYVLDVIKYSNSEIVQFAHETFGYGRFVRQCYQGTWAAWQELALNSNLTPSYDTLTLNSGITGTLRIMRIGKLRSIYGNVQPSSSGTDITLCALADTDKPPINLTTSYSGYSLNSSGEVNIYSNGRLSISANSVPSNGLKFSVTYAVN